RPVVAGVLARLQRAAAMRKRLVTDAASDAEKVTVLSGSRDLPSGAIVSANDESFTIARRSGKEESKRWSEVDLDTMYQRVLKRWATSDENRLDLAWLLLDAGLIESATEILVDIDPSSARKEDLASLREDLQRERQANAALQSIHTFYDAAKGGDDGAWFRVQSEIAEFLDRHRGTRAFFRETDGSTSWSPRRL
ncbi:MAG: hypothetical protein KDB53_19285, partial [Planctomycetes bacterium]|nr:hypothetical protein [Planctomycetota bacterium]